MIRISIATGTIAGVTVLLARPVMRPSVRIGRALVWISLVLGLCWLALAPIRVWAAAVDTMLTPWEGFTASVGESFGVVGNPASLSWLDKHVLRIQGINPGTNAVPGGQTYTYLEADNGFGAGQLGYAAMEQGGRSARQWVYSGAWRDGDSALGVTIKHVSLDNLPHPGTSVSTWAIDLGYRRQWTDRVAVGVVAHDALLFFGTISRDLMPLRIAAGLTVDVTEGLVLAADYLTGDLTAPGVSGYRYGLDGRFGRVLARVGQRRFVANDYVYSYFGLGYDWDLVRLDATAGKDKDGSVFSLGMSWYF